MRLLTLSLTIFILLWSYAAAARSPCRRAIYANQYGCRCEEDPNDPGYPLAICRDFLYPNQLTNAVHYFESAGQPVSTFSLEESSLTTLGNAPFRNLHLKRIRLGNTKLLSLGTPSYGSPFEGLEGSLEVIEVIGNPYVRGWDFNQMRGLRKLSLLYLNHCFLQIIGPKKFNLLPKNLRYLVIMDAKVNRIDEGAFLNLNLNNLDLSNNYLATFPPRTLPRLLENLILKNNSFSRFPEAVLENQPRLTYLDLSYNRIQGLDPVSAEKLNQLAYNNRFITLNLSGNPLRCCTLASVRHQRILYNIIGTCNLQGRMVEIKNINLVSLRPC